MAKVTLYGIPSSAYDTLKSWFSGPIKLALWRLIVLTLTVLGIIAAIAVWPVGLVLGIAAFPLAWFWGDDIKAILLDVWNMEWAEVST